MIQNKLYVVVVSLALTSCNLNTVYNGMVERQMVWQFDNARYVQNVRNGLCYMVVDAYHAVGLVCVPCDSLKGEFVMKINPRQ